MTNTIVLMAAGFVEFCILAYVCFYVMAYVVPWGDMREKREIAKAIASRIPALRERAAAAVRLAKQETPRLRHAGLADISARISQDSVRLATLCATFVETVAREHRMYPREALQIEKDLNATLGVVETLCHTRDERLPAVAKLYVDMAAEQLRATESVRQGIWNRACELADAGVPVQHELMRLTMLANAIVAYGGIVESDTDAIAELAPKWATTLRHIAESFELRAVVHERLQQVRAEMPTRTERVRALHEGARSRLSALRHSAAHAGVALRMAALESLEEGIAQGRKELHEAERTCVHDGHDVGSGGETYRRLTAALRDIERANARLQMYEEDLSLIAAVVAATAGEDPKNVN